MLAFIVTSFSTSIFMLSVFEKLRSIIMIVSILTIKVFSYLLLSAYGIIIATSIFITCDAIDN